MSVLTAEQNKIKQELIEYFNDFLKSEKIQLHKAQREVSDILIEKAVTDNGVYGFFSSPRTGKTTLFNLLEKFFVLFTLNIRIHFSSIENPYLREAYINLLKGDHHE